MVTACPPTVEESQQQLNLRWHSHTSTFTDMLASLVGGSTEEGGADDDGCKGGGAPYSDLVLCCDGGRVQAHRAVMSLCSPYLAHVLSNSAGDCLTPTAGYHTSQDVLLGRACLLLPEVPVRDVHYLVSFIYCGQVDVPQTHLASFLNTGKHLHVLGLEQGDRLVATPDLSEGSPTPSSCPSDPEDVDHVNDGEAPPDEDDATSHTSTSTTSRSQSQASRPASRSTTPQSQGHAAMQQLDRLQHQHSATTSVAELLLLHQQQQQQQQLRLQQQHLLDSGSAAVTDSSEVVSSNKSSGGGRNNSGGGGRSVSDVNANLTPHKRVLQTNNNNSDINSTNINSSSEAALSQKLRLKQEMDEERECPLNPHISIKEENMTDRDDLEDTTTDLRHSVFSTSTTTSGNNTTTTLLHHSASTTSTTTTPTSLAAAAVAAAAAARLSAAAAPDSVADGGSGDGCAAGNGVASAGIGGNLAGIIGSDGRIDLNFYLQQAIQCASMPCPLCDKEFKSQSGLRDHIRLHTGERPFICDFCHMNFARASHLKRHRRMHTGEKPFDCPICGKDFSRGDKLKDHLKRHDADEKLNKIRKQIFNPEDCSSPGSPAGDGAGTNPSLAPTGNTHTPQQQQQQLSIGVKGYINGGLPISSTAGVVSGGGGGGGVVSAVGAGTVGDAYSSIGERMANLVARANPQAVTPDSVMSAKTTTVATAAALQQMQLQQQHLRQQQLQQHIDQQQQISQLQQHQQTLLQQQQHQGRRSSFSQPVIKKRKLQHNSSCVSSSSPSVSSNQVATISMITNSSSNSSTSNIMTRLVNTSSPSQLAATIVSINNPTNTTSNIISHTPLVGSVSNNSNNTSASGSGISGNIALHHSNTGNADTILPHMLGVASIGECILRPIN